MKVRISDVQFYCSVVWGMTGDDVLETLRELASLEYPVADGSLHKSPLVLLNLGSSVEVGQGGEQYIAANNIMPDLLKFERQPEVVPRIHSNIRAQGWEIEGATDTKGKGYIGAFNVKEPTRRVRHEVEQIDPFHDWHTVHKLVLAEEQKKTKA